MNCAVYTIPSQSNVSDPWPIDWYTYKERHLVECFFQKLKWFRRVFTRYDKLDVSFLAFIHIAAIAILLKQHDALSFFKQGLMPTGLSKNFIVLFRHL